MASDGIGSNVPVRARVGAIDRPFRPFLRVMLAVATCAILGCDRLPTGPAAAGGAIRAVTLAEWSADGLAGGGADAALDWIGATGANTVTLIVTAYQADAHAAALRENDPRTPSPGAVRHAIAHARALGLAVVLKPHVDLDDGAWRGTIAPADPGTWFASYRAFVRPWAQLADSIGSPVFVVGTELAGTLANAARWRELVRETRAVYSGRLTYAASWDEATRVPFWDALDRIGVDAYFPVTGRRDAGRTEMLAGWQPWLARLRTLARQSGKPILLTELGYRSVDGAGMAPFASSSSGTPDPGEQADLYWAALQATSAADEIEGLCWWNCLANGSGGQTNTDYTPVGKPAARVLAAAWATPAP